jgi:steroid delta-isomerase-like uncharacterized protein
MIANQMLPVVVAEYLQKWVEGINNGDLSIANDIFHADCVVHINGNTERDLSVDEFRQMLAGMLNAFPDLHFTINDQFGSGERFAARWTATGTHTGTLGPMQPSGKVINIEGHIIDYITNGKVSRRWEIWDQWAMMQQLGVV